MIAIPASAGIYQLDYHGLLYVGASTNIRKRVNDHLKRDSSSRWVWRLADAMVLDFGINRQQAVSTIVDITTPSVLEVFNDDCNHVDLANAENRWIAQLRPILNDDGANGKSGGYKQRVSRGRGSLWLEYGQRLQKLKAENDTLGALWQQTYVDDCQAEFDGLSIRSEQVCRSIARLYSLAQQKGLQSNADELVESGLTVNKLKAELKRLVQA